MLLRLLALTCLASISAHADEILGQGKFRYRTVKHWGAEALAQVSVKNGHAVAIDAKNRLFFLTDDPRNNVIIIEPSSGALIGQWTARMPGAHGLTLATELGREILLITDTVLHEVRKLTLDGEEIARFPWPEQSGLYTKAGDYRPSKALHHPSGEFFVFDGYGKDYVHHYSAAGELIRSWGGDLGAGENQLLHWGPHGGALDLRSEPRILVAMSDRQEIKRFDLKGRFIDKFAFPGGNPRDVVLWGEHAIVPHLGDQWPKDRNSPGYLSIIDGSFKVVSNIGAPPPVYVDGVLQPMKSDGKSFIHPHGVAVDADGNLYVAQFASPSHPLLKLERLK